ncbi:MAG: YbgC/FadM family acyl-CoA thioesterase [Nitrospinota bacterium]
MISKLKINIYYEDTDAAGLVYYANYLKYFERARTEYFKIRGFNPFQLANNGILFVVQKASIEYKSAARLGDTIKVETSILKIRGARVIFGYRVILEQQERLIVTGRTDLACVTNDMKPQRIPDKIVTILEQNS